MHTLNHVPADGEFVVDVFASRVPPGLVAPSRVRSRLAANGSPAPFHASSREFCNFPMRSASGTLVLSPGHFGLQDPILLFALLDLVKGVSNRVSASRMFERLGVRVSRCMIRDTFRGRLYQDVRRFAGDAVHIPFSEFCAREGLGEPFRGMDNNQAAFSVARYLLEVFDLYEPVTVTLG